MWNFITHVISKMYTWTVANSDFEIKREPGFILLTQPAFLPLVISSFFTQTCSLFFTLDPLLMEVEFQNARRDFVLFFFVFLCSLYKKAVLHFKDVRSKMF